MPNPFPVLLRKALRQELATEFPPQCHYLKRPSAVPAPLVITIAHTLGKDEALRRIRPALGKASDSFPVLSVERETWTGDRMDFQVRAMGQRAAGWIEVADDHVRLEITLPWLLHKFAKTVQNTLQARGRLLLGKK